MLCCRRLRDIGRAPTAWSLISIDGSSLPSIRDLRPERLVLHGFDGLFRHTVGLTQYLRELDVETILDVWNFMLEYGEKLTHLHTITLRHGNEDTCCGWTKKDCGDFGDMLIQLPSLKQVHLVHMRAREYCAWPIDCLTRLPIGTVDIFTGQHHLLDNVFARLVVSRPTLTNLTLDCLSIETKHAQAVESFFQSWEKDQCHLQSFAARNMALTPILAQELVKIPSLTSLHVNPPECKSVFPTLSKCRWTTLGLTTRDVGEQHFVSPAFWSAQDQIKTLVLSGTANDSLLAFLRLHWRWIDRVVTLDVSVQETRGSYAKNVTGMLSQMSALGFLYVRWPEMETGDDIIRTGWVLAQTILQTAIDVMPRLEHLEFFNLPEEVCHSMEWMALEMQLKERNVDLKRG